MSLQQYTSDYLRYMAEKKVPDTKLRDKANNSLQFNSFQMPKKSFFLALSDGLMGASIPLEIFWAILYVTSLSFAMMTGLAVIIGAASLAIGAGLAWRSYYKGTKEQNKLNDEFVLAMCQEEIYRELVDRQKTKILRESEAFLRKIIHSANERGKRTEIMAVLQKWNMLSPQLLSDQAQLLAFAKNKKIQSELIAVVTNKPSELSLYTISRPAYPPIRPEANQFSTSSKAKAVKAVLGGIALKSALFGSFFVCASYMFLAMGLVAVTSVLSSPVIIGIALGVAALYGIYYGYRSYQYSINIKNKTAEIAAKNEEVTKLEYDYEGTKKMRKSLAKRSEELTHFIDEDKNKAAYAYTSFYTARRVVKGQSEDDHLRSLTFG